MMAAPGNPHSPPGQRIPFRALVVLVLAVYGCSIYANLALAVGYHADYRFFPPFQRYRNANNNNALGGESYHMALALAKGEGFAHPFLRATGPTAWHPPALPLILAGLLWTWDGNREAVMAVVVFLQVNILIATGLLVLALARQTTSRIGPGLATTVFLLGLLCEFRYCFQTTSDSWLVLLALDLLLAGLCCCQPLRCWPTAAGWGLVGGLSTLINPVLGLAWGFLSVLVGLRDRNGARLTLALLLAGLALTPWTVRNYLVLGRLIPVKSNLAYELYQSQCLQPDGLLQGRTFLQHPWGANNKEGQEYTRLGEPAYLKRKEKQFLQAVQAAPLDFLCRAGTRFVGATLWYVPFNREEGSNRPLALWISRVTYPLPFLALLVLLGTAFRQRLQRTQWLVIGVYILYLLPYVAISYYERYAAPLVGVKCVLVLWGIDRFLSLRSGPETTEGRLADPP